MIQIRCPTKSATTIRSVDFSSAHDIVAGLHAMALGEPDDRVLASGELHSLEDLCQVAFSAVGLDWRAHVTSTKPAGERPALIGRYSELSDRRIAIAGDSMARESTGCAEWAPSGGIAENRVESRSR